MRSDDKSNRTRQGIIYVQAEYRKMAGQIAALSLAILGLPVLFFKDIFGIHLEKGQSIFSAIYYSDNRLFLGLFFLSYLFIIFEFYNLYNYSNYNITMTRKTHSANNPSAMWDEEREAELMLNRYFNRALISFAAGAFSMIFALVIFIKP